MGRYWLQGLSVDDVLHACHEAQCMIKSCWAKSNLLHTVFRAVSLKDWFGPGGDAMQAAGISLKNMRHVHSQTYQLQCNWKVFCDNYLVR